MSPGNLLRFDVVHVYDFVLLLICFQFLRHCTGESVVFVIDQPPLANRRIRNAVQQSVEEYLRNFMTDFSNAAIITLGGSKSASKPLQLIQNDQIGRSQILSKINSDFTRSSPTDFLSLESALKNAIRVAKSSATSLKSIFVLTTNASHHMSDLCNLQIKTSYFMHVLHISPSMQPLIKCALQCGQTYQTLRKYVSQGIIVTVL